jgi:hypothetical protein
MRRLAQILCGQLLSLATAIEVEDVPTFTVQCRVEPSSTRPDTTAPITSHHVLASGLNVDDIEERGTSMVADAKPQPPDAVFFFADRDDMNTLGNREIAASNGSEWSTPPLNMTVELALEHVKVILTPPCIFH